MMKSIVAAAVLSVVGLTVANAQERTIVEEHPAITIPLPGVAVEKREAPVVERREVETTGRGGCELQDGAPGRPGRIDHGEEGAVRLTRSGALACSAGAPSASKYSRRL